MMTFEVSLTKSYIVRIKAENESQAKEFSQIYTNDISDISSSKEKVDNNFEIENIECTVNEVFETREV